MKKWIVVDLDGTLCDCSHRVHLAQAKLWDEFNSGITEDKPNMAIVSLIESMSRHDYRVLLCTGRDEEYKKPTMDWLFKMKLSPFFEELLMRPKGNRDPDHEVKLQLIEDFFGSREKALADVLFTLEDRDRVVLAFRDAGFQCFQVTAGNY